MIESSRNRLRFLVGRADARLLLCGSLIRCLAAASRQRRSANPDRKATAENP
jgi:hypothetical protein